MNKELTAYSIEDTEFEICKRYCRNGNVIARRISYVVGFSISIMWHEWYKPIEFKGYIKNIFKLHWYISKEYLHRTGEIVYQSED